MKSKFIRFATSSFTSFLIDYAMFCALSFIFPDTKLWILAANIIARIVSAICNYMMNCRFVFGEERSTKSTVQYFILAAFILCMNNVVLLLFSLIPGLKLYIAKVFTELSLFVMNYFIQKKIIFRHKF